MTATLVSKQAKASASSTVRPQRSKWQAIHESGFAPFGIFVLLALIVGFYDNTFFQMRSLMSLLEQSVPLVLLALAQGFVVLTGRITLANATLASLCGVVLAQLLGSLGAVALPLVLLIAAVLGAVMGLVHTITQLPSFIVTLGFMGIFAGLSLWISGADSVLVTTGFDSVQWLFLRLYGVPIAFVLVLLLTLALMLAMKIFHIGAKLRALGLNERAAAFSGIRTGRIVVGVFALSAVLSALAATMQVAQLQSAGATTSDSLLLPSIAAVLVGGCSIAGGVGGAGRMLMGAMVIALLRVGLDLVGIDSAYQPIFYGVIVILAIAATVDRRRGSSVA